MHMCVFEKELTPLIICFSLINLDLNLGIVVKRSTSIISSFKFCLIKNIYLQRSEETSAVSALVSMFVQQEELARTEERKTDAILAGGDKSAAQQTNQKSTEEFIEETVALCKS